MTVNSSKMKRLLLLLLLKSWTHFGSSEHHCDTGVAISGNILNIDGSLAAKANATFLHAYSSDSLQKCLEDCCSKIYGTCSVASFKNHSKGFICLHFYCEPLAKCKFIASEGCDSYAFPGTILHSNHLSFSSLNSKSIETASSEDPKSHPRSVTARKGVENVVITRKGISSSIFVDDSIATKNDNTTVKPRKGVEFIPELHTSISSVITPQTVTNSVDQSVHKKPKIFPRKGVELFPSDTSTLLPSSELPSYSTYSSDNSDGFKYAQSSSHTPSASSITDFDFMSALRNVFRDENESDSEISKIASLHSNSDKLGLTVASTVSPEPTYFSSSYPTESSAPSISLSAILSSAFDETTTVPHVMDEPTFLHSSESASVILSSGRYKSRFDVESTLFPSMSQDQTILASDTFHKIQSLQTTTPLEEVMKNSRYISVIKPSETSVTVTPTVFEVPSDHFQDVIVDSRFEDHEPPKVSDNHEVLDKASVESEADRRYKSSMHLVLSLVFGLLVLCAVFGAVAKRIYDVWMRRHYHRMDFLIDGLYDGYS